jgi:hypothetical protein
MNLIFCYRSYWQIVQRDQQMTKSVGNEAIEKYCCFLSGKWHWSDVSTRDDILKTFLVIPVMFMLLNIWW